ncbi:hypothetical protein Kpol_1032p63 [Vanderwaltozyma polyspora DSM 70294]|uniref:t-SNARE coiled-coil homology domain-containing protein n=1 Tax=Vanderwaltozyma polyspora (strain ATCC 22028 / DSM 70294 / BCRC 21397 / CBS 2163 / NBRC 10782 / NRRL Y-8283 / UCD 57-17) TaxID=436907 RepID=A7TH17_VANPO|nr:uncharacterized protein Kpol_1032p63 [Vanderwaltozyma polyspora DSM 70294]EDO18469.1 hypothetical protein Kpol_1032p63 [Vanderwaltozyma polyspora DSM 70294]
MGIKKLFRFRPPPEDTKEKNRDNLMELGIATKNPNRKKKELFTAYGQYARDREFDKFYAPEGYEQYAYPQNEEGDLNKSPLDSDASPSTSPTTKKNKFFRTPKLFHDKSQSNIESNDVDLNSAPYDPYNINQTPNSPSDDVYANFQRSLDSQSNPYSQNHYTHRSTLSDPYANSTDHYNTPSPYDGLTRFNDVGDSYNNRLENSGIPHNGAPNLKKSLSERIAPSRMDNLISSPISGFSHRFSVSTPDTQYSSGDEKNYKNELDHQPHCPKKNPYTGMQASHFGVNPTNPYSRRSQSFKSNLDEPAKGQTHYLSTPTQSSFQSPAQSSFQSPAQSSFQSPAQSSFQSPAQSLFQSPAQSSFQSPAQSSFQSPAQAPVGTHIQSPMPSPAPISTQPITSRHPIPPIPPKSPLRMQRNLSMSKRSIATEQDLDDDLNAEPRSNEFSPVSNGTRDIETSLTGNINNNDTELDLNESACDIKDNLSTMINETKDYVLNGNKYDMLDDLNEVNENHISNIPDIVVAPTTTRSPIQPNFNDAYQSQQVLMEEEQAQLDTYTDFNADASNNYGTNMEQNRGFRTFEEIQREEEERQKQEEEEEVDEIKQEIRFTKQSSLASTRNTLKMAREAELAGMNTIGMLGHQSEKLNNIQTNLDIMKAQTEVAGEHVDKLRNLNRSILAVHVKNPFNSKRKRMEREEELKSRKMEQQYMQEHNNNVLSTSTARIEGILSLNNDESSVREKYKRKEILERAKKYQFENDEEDDAIEVEIDRNLDSIQQVSHRLKKLAIAAGEEVDDQNNRVKQIETDTDMLDIDLHLQTTKLSYIR